MHFSFVFLLPSPFLLDPNSVRVFWFSFLKPTEILFDSHYVCVKNRSVRHPSVWVTVKNRTKPSFWTMLSARDSRFQRSPSSLCKEYGQTMFTQHGSFRTQSTLKTWKKWNALLRCPQSLSFRLIRCINSTFSNAIDGNCWQGLAAK